MLASAPQDADDGDALPQLKFKVPNFMGSLTERRRPAFSNDNIVHEENLQNSLQSVPPKDTGSNVQFIANARVQEQPEQAPANFPRPPVERKADGDLTPVKPINLFKQARQTQASFEERQMNYDQGNKIEPSVYTATRPGKEDIHYQTGAHESYNSVASSNLNYQQTSQEYASKDSIQYDQRQSDFNYSIEADHYLNQIVTLLAHFRSLGRKGSDAAIQLEAQLALERENSNQQKSLAELERQAKAMVQEELFSARKSINTLTERLSHLQQAKAEVEREKIQLENLKRLVEKDLESSNVEKELQRSELETMHTSTQDLERSLVNLSDEKAKLENELCKLKASSQEQEGRLAKELKMAIKRSQELQESIAQQETKQTEIAKQLDCKDLENNQLKGCIKELAILLGEEVSSETDFNDLIKSILKLVKDLKDTNIQAELSFKKHIEELQASVNQKQEALDCCQATIVQLHQQVDGKNGDLKILQDVSELKFKEMQASVHALMSESGQLREVVKEKEDLIGQFKSLLGLAADQSSIEDFKRVIVGLKSSAVEKMELVSKEKSELEISLTKERSSHEAEKSSWELERQRLLSDRLKLVQENEALKRSTPTNTTNNNIVSSSSKGTTTDSIMKAIEADLMKSKALGKSPGAMKNPIDEGWTVSDSTIKSPLKRQTSSRPSSRRKRSNSSAGKAHYSRDSPLSTSHTQQQQQHGPSELDFWAFSKENN